MRDKGITPAKPDIPNAIEDMGKALESPVEFKGAEVLPELPHPSGCCGGGHEGHVCCGKHKHHHK